MKTSLAGHTDFFTGIRVFMTYQQASPRMSDPRRKRPQAFCDPVLEMPHCHWGQVSESRPYSKEGGLCSLLEGRSA